MHLHRILNCSRFFGQYVSLFSMESEEPLLIAESSRSDGVWDLTVGLAVSVLGRSGRRPLFQEEGEGGTIGPASLGRLGWRRMVDTA